MSFNPNEISLNDDDGDDDKNESSYALDVVKPPSVDELYDWYRKYDGRDTEADPSGQTFGQRRWN